MSLYDDHVRQQVWIAWPPKSQFTLLEVMAGLTPTNMSWVYTTRQSVDTCNANGGFVLAWALCPKCTEQEVSRGVLRDTHTARLTSDPINRVSCARCKYTFTL